MSETPDGFPSYGYTLYRLAEGSYDIDLGGRTIGSLVKSSSGWIAELLDESELPAPFTKPEHNFDKLIDAFQWLGMPAREQR